jgi:hypothetical protein
MSKLQNILHHSFSFGCNVRHDSQICDRCLAQFGIDPHLEIPLKNQQLVIKSTTSRFCFLIFQCPCADVNEIKQNFQKCFKMQLFRICMDQGTFIPPTQEKINDELQSLSNIVKPGKHLFIYTNVKRDLNLVSFQTNTSVWIILDYPNSSKDAITNLDNVVTVCLCGTNNVDSHPLSKCFNEIRRETLSQLLTRLKLTIDPSLTPLIKSKKPMSSYFGFE